MSGQCNRCEHEDHTGRICQCLCRHPWPQSVGNGVPPDPWSRSYGTDLETARTEYNAAGAEVRHAQERLDQAYRALVDASERYGGALEAAERSGVVS